MRSDFCPHMSTHWSACDFFHPNKIEVGLTIITIVESSSGWLLGCKHAYDRDSNTMCTSHSLVGKFKSLTFCANLLLFNHYQYNKDVSNN